MTTPTIDHPTNRDNYTVVTIGALELWFSYRTIVGFRDARNAHRGVRVTRNYWGTTTGKHLNDIDHGAKDKRLDAEDFALELAQALEGITETEH